MTLFTFDKDQDLTESIDLEQMIAVKDDETNCSRCDSHIAPDATVSQTVASYTNFEGDHWVYTQILCPWCQTTFAGSEVPIYSEYSEFADCIDYEYNRMPNEELERRWLEFQSLPEDQRKDFEDHFSELVEMIRDLYNENFPMTDGDAK